MPALCFFLALGLGFSALRFWEANQQISIGVAWAVDVCSTSRLFCLDSEYLAYAGGVMLVPGDWIQTRQRNGMNAS
jgi:hypothetical protein